MRSRTLETLEDDPAMGADDEVLTVAAAAAASMLQAAHAPPPRVGSRCPRHTCRVPAGYLKNVRKRGGSFLIIILYLNESKDDAGCSSPLLIYNACRGVFLERLQAQPFFFFRKCVGGFIDKPFSFMSWEVDREVSMDCFAEVFTNACKLVRFEIFNVRFMSDFTISNPRNNRCKARCDI